MYDFSRPLGNAVKKARITMKLTQKKVADLVRIDNRTVLNIENFKGNPKMTVLYPIIRCLRIDPWDIFYPEMQRESPSLRKIRLLIEDCSEEEAEAILPVIQSVLNLLRKQSPGSVEK